MDTKTIDLAFGCVFIIGVLVLASRAGRSDLSVNRRRMEEIRQAFNASCIRAGASGE